MRFTNLSSKSDCSFPMLSSVSSGICSFSGASICGIICCTLFKEPEASISSCNRAL